MTRTFTDLELERLLADDPGGPSAARFEAEATPADRDARQRLADADAAFLATTDVDARVAAIVVGLGGGRSSSPVHRRWLLAVAGAAAIAAAVAMIALRTAAPEPAAIALGPVTFEIEVATTAEAWGPIRSAPVRTGDPLRFAVTAPAAGFVAIAGVDGDAVTWFAPAHGPVAGAYRPGQSMVVAAAPVRSATQRVFVAYSRRAVPLAELAAVLTGRTAKPSDVVFAGPTELRTVARFVNSNVNSDE